MLLLLRVQRYTAFSEKPNFRERKKAATLTSRRLSVSSIIYVFPNK